MSDVVRPFWFYCMVKYIDGVLTELKFGLTTTNVHRYVRKYKKEGFDIERYWFKDLSHVLCTGGTKMHDQSGVLPILDSFGFTSKSSGREYRNISVKWLRKRNDKIDPYYVLMSYVEQAVAQWVNENTDIVIPSLDKIANTYQKGVSEQPPYDPKFFNNKHLDSVVSGHTRTTVHCPVVRDIVNKNRDHHPHTKTVGEFTALDGLGYNDKNDILLEGYEMVLDHISQTSDDVLFINPPFSKARQFVDTALHTKANKLLFIVPCLDWCNTDKDAHYLWVMNKWYTEISFYLPNEAFSLPDLKSPVAMVYIDRTIPSNGYVLVNGVPTKPNQVAYHELYSIIRPMIPTIISDSINTLRVDIAIATKQKGYKYLSFCNRYKGANAGKRFYYNISDKNFIIDDIGYEKSPTWTGPSNPDIIGQWNIFKCKDTEIDNLVSWIRHPLAVAFVHINKLEANLASYQFSVLPNIDLSVPPTDDHLISQIPGLTQDTLNTVYEWYMDKMSTSPVSIHNGVVIHHVGDPTRPNKVASSDEYFTGRGMVEIGYKKITSGMHHMDIIEQRYIDYAVGYGNIIIPVLEYKIGLLGREPTDEDLINIVGTVYGIDISEDSITETKRRIHEVLYRYSTTVDARDVVNKNVIVGDSTDPMTLPKWALDVLYTEDTMMDFYSRNKKMFSTVVCIENAILGDYEIKHDIISKTKTHGTVKLLVDTSKGCGEFPIDFINHLSILHGVVYKEPKPIDDSLGILEDLF